MIVECVYFGNNSHLILEICIFTGDAFTGDAGNVMLYLNYVDALIYF